MMAHSRNSSSGDGKQVLSLPFGYRFYPTNYEVIRYLKHKILERELPADIIPTIDVYSHSPDQLPLGKVPLYPSVGIPLRFVNFMQN